jgi:hypothetical protein
MLLLMYCAGPFNFHPLKLPMQYIFGSSYHRAYRHFRNNHSIPVNIVAHLLGLAHILLANFALLHEVDARVLEPAGFTFGVALPTALMWGLLLCSTPSPLAVRVCALGALAAGVSLRSVWSPVWSSALVTWEAPLHALFLRYGDAKAVPTLSQLPFFVLFLARLALQLGGEWLGLVGYLKDYSMPINTLLLGLLVYSSIEPFRKRLNCYWAGVFGWVVGLLTDQPFCYFYGAGYVASLCQGVAHQQTGEMANLPELALRDGKERAGDEHAHTAFFPVLILHSAYESFVAPQAAHEE